MQRGDACAGGLQVRALAGDLPRTVDDPAAVAATRPPRVVGLCRPRTPAPGRAGPRADRSGAAPGVGQRQGRDRSRPRSAPGQSPSQRPPRRRCRCRAGHPPRAARRRPCRVARRTGGRAAHTACRPRSARRPSRSRRQRRGCRCRAQSPGASAGSGRCSWPPTRRRPTRHTRPRRGRRRSPSRHSPGARHSPAVSSTSLTSGRQHHPKTGRRERLAHPRPTDGQHRAPSGRRAASSAAPGLRAGHHVLRRSPCRPRSLRWPPPLRADGRRCWWRRRPAPSARRQGAHGVLDRLGPAVDHPVEVADDRRVARRPGAPSGRSPTRPQRARRSLSGVPRSHHESCRRVVVPVEQVGEGDAVELGEPLGRRRSPAPRRPRPPARTSRGPRPRGPEPAGPRRRRRRAGRTRACVPCP